MLNFLFKQQPTANISELINAGATIIDVRSAMEFKMGHHPKSKNIALDAIASKIESIKKMKSPIVVCCASGARSGQAKRYLENNGVKDVHNGGSWTNI